MAATQSNYRENEPRAFTSHHANMTGTTVFELYRQLPEPVARVFRLLPVNPGLQISTAAAGALTQLPLEEADGTLTTLARSRLISADSNGCGRWRLDGLARTFAEEISDAYADGDQREEARDRLLSYYLALAGAANSCLRAPSLTNATAESVDQDTARAWLADERNNLIGAVRMAAATGRKHIAMRLPLRLATYFAQQQEFDDLLTITAISLDAARQHGDRGIEADALNNRGGAHLAIGQFQDAVTSLRAAVAIYRERSDHAGEGDALNNLGIGLRGVLQLEEAVAAHKAAVTVYRQLGDRHSEGGALNNLALDLRESRRIDDAIVIHEAAVAIYRETSDDAGEVRALENLETTRAMQSILTRPSTDYLCDG